MLRLILVVILIGIGIFFSAQSAFYTLLFYLWNAYFRPDAWTYGSFIQSLNMSYIVGAYLVLRTIVSHAKRPAQRANRPHLPVRCAGRGRHGDQRTH